VKKQKLFVSFSGGFSSYGWIIHLLYLEIITMNLVEHVQQNGVNYWRITNERYCS